MMIILTLVLRSAANSFNRSFRFRTIFRSSLQPLTILRRKQILHMNSKCLFCAVAHHHLEDVALLATSFSAAQQRVKKKLLESTINGTIKLIVTSYRSLPNVFCSLLGEGVESETGPIRLSQHEREQSSWRLHKFGSQILLVDFAHVICWPGWGLT